ncbi:MAG TPA: hypothetical protein VF026_29140 [Ktedonobacteraceae bacterium]
MSLPSSPGTLWHAATATLLVICPEIRGDTVVASISIPGKGTMEVSPTHQTIIQD